MAVSVSCFPMGPIKANTYILTDASSGKTAVIDAGGCTPECKQALAGKDVQYILLTHGHFDHILGVAEFKALTGAEVCIHEADAACLTDEAVSLCSWEYPGRQTAVPADQLLKDGDVIELGETKLTVLHTPGHTKGGVCYVDYENRLLFSGDTLFCLTAGRTDFPGGDDMELMSSLIRLRNLDGDFKVYPGHNRATTLESERTRNRYMRRIGK